MNHIDLARTETWNHNPTAVTCVCCGKQGTGLVRDGWDRCTDDEGDHDICADCAAPEDDPEGCYLDHSDDAYALASAGWGSDEDYW